MRQEVETKYLNDGVGNGNYFNRLLSAYKALSSKFENGEAFKLTNTSENELFVRYVCFVTETVNFLNDKLFW